MIDSTIVTVEDIRGQRMAVMQENFPAKCVTATHLTHAAGDLRSAEVEIAHQAIQFVPLLSRLADKQLSSVVNEAQSFCRLPAFLSREGLSGEKSFTHLQAVSLELLRVAQYPKHHM